tara:strand:- start:271 stop:756 length:486 start_codon:yes stop_codon:yes gene_type:complete
MKKFLILMTLLPGLSFATTSIEVAYLDMSIDGISEDPNGEMITFGTTMGEGNNWQVRAGFANVEGYDGKAFDINYGFNDFSEGTFYIGATRSDSDLADSETDVHIGYRKMAGEAGDWHIGLMDGEDDILVDVGFVIGPGITLEFGTGDGVDILALGYRFVF